MDVRVCSACGCESYVVDTRSSTYKKNEVIYRRRQCPNCKKRWSTLEVPSRLVMRHSRGGSYILEDLLDEMAKMEDDI